MQRYNPLFKMINEIIRIKFLGVFCTAFLKTMQAMKNLNARSLVLEREKVAEFLLNTAFIFSTCLSGGSVKEKLNALFS